MELGVYGSDLGTLGIELSLFPLLIGVVDLDLGLNTLTTLAEQLYKGGSVNAIIFNNSALIVTKEGVQNMPSRALEYWLRLPDCGRPYEYVGGGTEGEYGSALLIYQ